ncbi:MAG TPA: NUDIX hydrolase [Candidatus Binataceae bacterium]|nr:NUDIX hydrolase [Candidatus Binataceae bacterium]
MSKERRERKQRSGWPRVIRRRGTRLSPWVEVIEREVQFAAAEPAQTYHGLALSDYVTIVAVTRDGKFPLVRQFRPAIEDFTVELPSGLVDDGENPYETCVRELREETGFDAVSVHDLGVTWVDVGRLNNHLHAFFVVAGERAADFKPEPGLEISLVTPTELVEIIKSDKLAMQIHVGVVLQAVLRGYLNPDLSRR